MLFFWRDSLVGRKWFNWFLKKIIVYYFVCFSKKFFCLLLWLYSNEEKYSFLAFRRSDFLCFWNKNLFSSLSFFRKGFLILLQIIIALEIYALMNNGLWLARKYCLFCGMCLLKTSQQIEENASMPSFSK